MATGTTGPTGTTGTAGATSTGASGASMASFVIRSRTTHEIAEETVSAAGREQAIAQKVDSVAPGEQIEVLSVEQVPVAAAGATGATGTSEVGNA